MVTPTQLKIIGLLLSTETPLSIREISRRLSQSYPLIYNNIQDLCLKKVLSKQDVPPAQIITLHSQADTKILIAAENLKRDNFLHKHKWVKLFLRDFSALFPTSFYSFIVFGSYAKGKESKSSDLDLLLIISSSIIPEKVNYVLDRCYTKIKKHLVIITEDDFSEMLAKPKELNVGNETVKNHVILYGAESYYTLLERVQR
jgi:predicted nucleotidyltransferase